MTLRPFLKWVGGKRQLLPVLRRFYPENVGAYFEPFLGSGAVFFDLAGRGAINGHGAVLSDDNPDLIGCYRRLRTSLDEIVANLEELARDHAVRGRECYMQVRDERFNPLRAEWQRSGADPDTYSAELSAMLIYLNRTGYNGLFRVNASGVFNVPPGRYDRPRIVDRSLLMRAAGALSADNVRLERAGFNRVLDTAAPGDFVYFDPPYAPLTRTANFRGYTGRGFSDRDQEALQRRGDRARATRRQCAVEQFHGPVGDRALRTQPRRRRRGVADAARAGAARDQFECRGPRHGGGAGGVEHRAAGRRSGSCRPMAHFQQLQFVAMLARHMTARLGRPGDRGDWFGRRQRVDSTALSGQPVHRS